jgi:hypothetical protein
MAVELSDLMGGEDRQIISTGNNELDKKIAELQGLGELKTAPKRAGRKPGKKRGRKAQVTSRPGSLSTKLVEVLQGKKSNYDTDIFTPIRFPGAMIYQKPS